MKFVTTLICTAAIAAGASGTAVAGDHLKNTYFGVSAGASFADSGDISVPALNTTAKDVTKYNTGFNFAMNAGYRFGEYFRAQADFGYLSNDVDKLDASSIAAGLPTDVTTTLSGFYGVASVYADYHATDKLSLFAGIGAGAFAPQFDNLSVPGASASAKIKVKDNLAALLKVGAGASYSITSNLDLVASYDYLRSSKFSFKVEDASTPNPAEVRLSTHLAQVGLRYNF